MHFAYISDDAAEWDMVDSVNDARPSQFEDPWHNKQKDDPTLRDKVWRYWFDLEEINRAFYKLVFIVDFDDILDIDERGDEYACFPHIYAMLPKSRRVITSVCTPRETKCVDIDQARRIKFFPSSFPESERKETIPVDDTDVDI